MKAKVLSTLNWLPHYALREVRRTFEPRRRKPEHVYFCICDHFEPYWNGASRATARHRLQRWLDCYPRIAERYRDCHGNVLKYSFFYPEEEYRAEDLDALAALCHAGYGEVEIHLHHDDDTPENLRRTLVDYKSVLHERHGLLSRRARDGEIVYGFIHGNWALNNSRPDRRWCGVDHETSILLETGCYADFTMPSAPSDTQTRKVNSIYYAVDLPHRCKSHDWGVDARRGEQGEGLLMVQGPLSLRWGGGRLLPKIENGGLLGNNPPTAKRVRSWVGAGVCVQGAPEHVFVKIYTHGTQEPVMKSLFDDGGLANLFEALHCYAEQEKVKLHFVSARELAGVVTSLADKPCCS